MSLRICVLGSGSSGNSTVVRAASGNFLVDAGFGPRVTEQRLAGIAMSVADIRAIVLTHLDHDHFNPYWLLTILKHGIRVHVARTRVKAFLALPQVRDLQARLAAKRLAADALRKLIVPFDVGCWGGLEGDAAAPVPGVRMEALPLAHDAQGSHGFVIESGGYRVGYATDLGCVPERLIERFCGVDLLAIESNYDRQMELRSARPWMLKQRIMGGAGHLSNEQAFAAVRAILDRTQATLGTDRLPRHIVLLHRSRECNCPRLLAALFASDPRIAPVLTLAHQHQPTAWLCAGQPAAPREEQLALAWGLP